MSWYLLGDVTLDNEFFFATPVVIRTRQPMGRDERGASRSESSARS